MAKHGSPKNQLLYTAYTGLMFFFECPDTSGRLKNKRHSACQKPDLAEGSLVGWVVHRGGPHPQCETAKIGVSITQTDGNSPDLSSSTNVVPRTHPCSFISHVMIIVH